MNEKIIFVWPEGILPGISRDQLKEYKLLFESEFNENHLLSIGINGVEKEGQITKYFNSLTIYEHNLEILDSYNKINLVPFGEFLPLEEILRLIGIEKIIRICLSPFLKVLNIGRSASTIVVVGLTLGLGFGGGLMIKDVKQGLVAPRSAVGALIFINLFHSLIEDTAILLLIGPSLFTILVIRGFFVFAFTFLLIKIFNNFPINAYDRFLFSRPIHNLIKNLFRSQIQINYKLALNIN